MKIKSLLSILGLFYFSTVSASDALDAIADIKIYMTNDYPVMMPAFLKQRGIPLKVVNVDQPQAVMMNWQKHLDLFHGEEDAVKKLEQFVNSAEGKLEVESYKAMMMDTVAAYMKEIKKFPAIIINDTAVIYGEENLEVALRRFLEWRQAQ